MKKNSIVSVVAIFVLAGSLLAAPKADKKAGVPDKILMQRIWDGWATLDPANVAQYYAKGPHVFFDIAPLKYNSWDEYQDGVKKVLADYTAAKLTVNDDAEIHPAGDYTWGTATVSEDLTKKSGEHETGAFRWTVVWHNEGGQWLIVHEHVSEPLK